MKKDKYANLFEWACDEFVKVDPKTQKSYYDFDYDKVREKGEELGLTDKEIELIIDQLKELDRFIKQGTIRIAREKIGKLCKACERNMEAKNISALLYTKDEFSNLIERIGKEKAIEVFGKELINLFNKVSKRNPTVNEVLGLNEPLLDNAFVRLIDNVVYVGIESATKALTQRELDKISDRVFDLKPKLLEKYPGAEFVEIKVYGNLKNLGIKNSFLQKKAIEYPEGQEFPQTYYANLIGFDRKIETKIIVYDEEWTDVDIYYRQPLTGQWNENIDQIFSGWSEQDPEEDEKWFKLKEAHLNDDMFLEKVADEVTKEDDEVDIYYDESDLPSDFYDIYQKSSLINKKIAKKELNNGITSAKKRREYLGAEVRMLKDKIVHNNIIYKNGDRGIIKDITDDLGKIVVELENGRVVQVSEEDIKILKKSDIDYRTKIRIK